MAYEVIILGHLHMPLYFLGTFTEYPYLWSVSCFSTSLSVYWTAEYLYVILLGVLSVIYLKNKEY